ncbi:dTDP-glucose 4,6-dehydratase [compost metagenome]
MERGRPGEIYHLSPDRGYAVKEVVQTICDVMGHRFDDVTETVAERLGQDAAYVIDSTKARRELGWAPQVTLREGVDGVIDWVERYWDEIQLQPLEYKHKP